MRTPTSRFNEWMTTPNENEHLEFKEAKRNFHFEKLVKYCCALANEGGGRIILGVSNTPPRQIVGTQAFSDLQRTKAGLIERLNLRIEAEEYLHHQDRVIIFHVPPRPVGVPVHHAGAYWMRRGEELVPMLPDMLRSILEETASDFSSLICPEATLDDLDPHAIKELRRRWAQKSGNHRLLYISDEQLLADAQLTMEGSVTNAALVLLAKSRSQKRYLPNAEIIFEYRSSEASIEYQQRQEFQCGLFLYHNRLWELINLRNELQHFRDGLFLLDIPTFNEDVIREAVLNAICHRDYRHQGSVFIRQYPNKIVVESPGGFPEGINTDNLLYRQLPRNRAIAEALSRAGLVERAGQGFDKIFRICCRESKSLPDFTGTDMSWVFLTLQGTIQDPAFLYYLQKIGGEIQKSFTVDDYLFLHYLSRGVGVPDSISPRMEHLMKSGAIERSNQGRSTRYRFPEKYYSPDDGRLTRSKQKKRERDARKNALIKHLEQNGRVSLEDFHQVLPALSRFQIYRLLCSLRDEGRIHLVGRSRGGRWELRD